jgi:hypothetical protein
VRVRERINNKKRRGGGDVWQCSCRHACHASWRCYPFCLHFLPLCDPLLPLFFFCCLSVGKALKDAVIHGLLSDVLFSPPFVFYSFTCNARKQKKHNGTHTCTVVHPHTHAKAPRAMQMLHPQAWGANERLVSSLMPCRVPAG